MNAMGIIGIVTAIVGAAQQAAKLAIDAKPFVDILWNDVFGKGEPKTEAELDEIRQTVDTKLAELRVRLHMPLPPKQDDDV